MIKSLDGVLCESRDDFLRVLHHGAPGSLGPGALTTKKQPLPDEPVEEEPKGRASVYKPPTADEMGPMVYATGRIYR